MDRSNQPWKIFGLIIFNFLTVSNTYGIILAPAVPSASESSPGKKPIEHFPDSFFDSPAEEGVNRQPMSFDLKPNPTTSRTGIQEVGLIAGDLGFFPKTLFVTRDIPVRLFVTGASKKPLCIMMDNFQVKKQIRSEHIEEVTFTPTAPGQYRFYCPINGMEGTLLVKDIVFREKD